MRQTVKNRMIKNVQMMAVGMMATASIMGTAAAMGVKMGNIPFNVLANPFQAVMTQGVAAIELGSSGSCGDNATYELSMDGTLTISGTGVINVTAFKMETNIKKVVINEGITEIGTQAFQMCQNIEEISLPEGLQSIGDDAFSYCEKIRQIDIPSTVTYLGTDQFTGCNSLYEISGGEGITELLNYRSYFKCEGEYGNLSGYKGYRPTKYTGESEALKNYDWTKFDNRFLSDREDVKLTSSNGGYINGVYQGIMLIVYNDNTARIEGDGVLGFSFISEDDLEGVTEIEVVGDFTSLQGVPYRSSIKVWDLQQTTITEIAEDAFCNQANSNNQLEEVILPEGLQKIGNGAFQNCKQLKKINMPDSLTTLGTSTYAVFSGCESLQEIHIPDGVKVIGTDTFRNCKSLKTIYLPETLDRVGNNAFFDCQSLTTIVGGANLTLVGNMAFYVGYPYSNRNILETTLITENEPLTDHDWVGDNRKMNVESPVDPDEPLEPVKENWLYSSDDEAFITDKVQVGSVKDDFESLLDEFATVVGLDEKQGAKQNYETADASNEDTLVYCTKASDWIITIPKDLVMSGDDESRAEYVVGIYGNVDPAKRVTVTPAPSFEMTNTGNAEVKYNAQVNQTVTGINGMDIIESPEADVDDASQMSGTITANLKRAGSYRGTMTFTVDYVDHT